MGNGSDIVIPAWLDDTPENYPVFNPADFSDEYAGIVLLCQREIEEPSEESTLKIKWVKVLLDAVKQAKEEQRILDGLGAGVEYKLVLVQPPEPERTAPPEELPPGGNGKPPEEDVDEPDRTLH